VSRRWRQIDDAPVLNDSTQRGGFGAEQRGPACDLHLLGDFADLQLEVNARDRADLQFNSLRVATLNPGALDANVIARGPGTAASSCQSRWWWLGEPWFGPRR